MLKLGLRKIKPTKGFAHLIHYIFITIVPILAFLFVRLDLSLVAIAIIILAKWRMFAVQPRHWLAHVRTNAVDIMVSLSFVVFMIVSSSFVVQLIWLVLLETWVLFIKPKENSIGITLQALIAQVISLIAMFTVFSTAPSSLYVLGAGTIAYLCARHFLNAFDEPHTIQYSWLWAFFASSIVWVLSHWLLFYHGVAQPAIILGVVGYGLAGLYYLREHDKLTILIRRQIVFVMIAVIFLMLVLSDWGEGIVK